MGQATAETLAQVSIGAILLQFAINIFIAEGFSKMNSYMSLLQLIVYTILFLDFWIPDQLGPTIEAMLTIAQIDFIPELVVETILRNFFNLNFSEDNQASEKF